MRGETSNEDLEIMAEPLSATVVRVLKDCDEVKVVEDHSGSSADSVFPRFAVIFSKYCLVTGLASGRQEER